MADVEGKKLNELRVIDLKTELERRGLDKTGNKAALLDRLAKAIIKEGGDPDECLIIPSGGVSRSSPKKPIDTSIMIEDALETEIRKEEFNSNNFDGLDDSTSNVVDNSCSEELVINISTQPEEFEMECQENEQEPTITTTSEEPVSEKKSFISSEENSNVSAVEANGIDNEDSINLTIGEDEENLLAEESESNDRLKADGGEEKRLEESNDNSNSSINKKGDSKGSGRAESSASNKEGTSSLATAPNTTALKNKQDDEGCKSGDVTVKGPKKDDKEMSLAVSVNASSRNLWVSGLSSTTRATDLKQIFSKYGKVVGAKVVTNARTPGARCYGYVTMSTSDDAEKCIEYLHRTELHGRVISVEKAKGDSQQNHNRKREVTTKVEKKDEKEKSKELEPSEKEEEEEEEEKNESEKKMDDEIIKETEEKDEEDINDQENREDSPEMKDEGSLKDCDTRSIKSIGKKSDRERGNSREDKKRSWDRSRTSRSKSRERGRRDNVLSFDKIKEERERQRFREKERLIREEKRRRREDMERQRAIEREAARLEREREKLRMERERIEQEKAELLRLERERQKVEREKLERERLELKRQQMRMEETRRVPPPPALKRTSSDRREPRENYGEPERKRIIPEHPNRRHSPPERVPERRTDVMERVSERRVEAPVPSRYEGGRSKEMAMQKGFKRNTEFNPRNNREDQFSDVPRGGRDIIVRRDNRPNQNNMDHRPVKERYERPSFGRDREVHRSDDNHRSNRDNHNRYDNAKPNNNRDGRYVENNRQTGWHSGPPSKPFNSVNNHRNEQQTGWNSRSSDTRVNSRWNNSGNNMGNNNMGHPRSQVYQGGPTQSGFGMSQGNSGSYERFDPYKSSMQNMRKY